MTREGALVAVAVLLAAATAVAPHAAGSPASTDAAPSSAPILTGRPRVGVEPAPGRSRAVRRIARRGSDPKMLAGGSGVTVFEGMSNHSRVAPPDPTGDVSETQYVQSVNGLHGARVAVYDKTGALQDGPFDLAKLWDAGRCRNHAWGDPVVQFDPLAQRWLLTQFAFRFDKRGSPTGPYSECVAVSTSSDATGTYYPYSFRLTRYKLPDFPKFGVWPDGYYMSVHLLGRKGGTAQGIVALDRDSMLAGSATRELIFFVNADLFGLLPADVEGTAPPPTGSPNYLVVLRDDDLGAPRDQVFLYGFFADWDRPSHSRIAGLAKLTTHPFDSNVCHGEILCIPQKGTAMRLDASAGVPNIGAYLMYPLVYRNFGNHEALAFQHTVKAGHRRAGINWFELRDPSGTPFLYQQGTYSPDRRDRWVGSIAMDGAGDIALGYSTSSANDYPSIAYTGRAPGDPLGEMPMGDNAILDGAGSQTASPRWGDYTALAVDPSDDCTFWYTNEFYPTSSQFGWHTAIASFRLPGCPATSPSP